MNILLIDKRVSRYEDIVAAIDPALAVGIVFDYFEDTFETLKVRIRDLAVSNTNATPNSSVGLVQHNYRAPMFSMLASSHQCIVARAEARDPELATWTQFKEFVAWFKTEYNTAHFDLMACALYSDPNWKYLIDAITTQTGVEIRASTDNTGSALNGGNWFLESHTGVNLKGVYFTALIEDYRGILYIYPYDNREYSTKFAPGNVIAWGDEVSYIPYELQNNIVVAVYSITEGIFMALTTDGKLVKFGDSDYTNTLSVPYNLSSGGVVAVYSTQGAFAALKSDGGVVAWGNLNGGNINNPNYNSNTSGVVAIRCTERAFAALKSDGNVFAWGDSNYGGNINNPTYYYGGINSVITVYSTNGAFAALKTDGSIATWGDPNKGGGLVTASNIIAVYSTSEAFAALNNAGGVITWGSASNGGDSSFVSGGNLDAVIAIYSNSYAFAALKMDGSVVAWGASNTGGSLYFTNLTNYSTTSVVGNLGSGVVAICSNELAFAALKTDGSVVMWGSGWALPTSVSSANSGVVAVYATQYAFAALKSNGSVVAWGSSGYGTYGEQGGSAPDTVTAANSGVVAVYSTNNTFAALKNDGSMVVWGGSYYTPPNTVTDTSSGVVAVYSNKKAFAVLKSPTISINTSAFTDMDRYDILRKKENRRRLNLNTSNSNVFTLSQSKDITSFNPMIPADKILRIIVPQYVSASYTIASTATIPSGADSINYIIACDEGEPVTVSGTTYVNYGSYAYKRETDNTYTKLTAAQNISGASYTMYGGDGINSSGIALIFIELVVMQSESTLSSFAFTVPTTKSYGNEPFTITAPTTNSDGAITYSSNSPSIATIDAITGVIALVGVGDVTFTAMQAETVEYLYSTVTSNVLRVSLGATSLTAFSVADSKAYGDASFSIAPPTIGRAGAIVYGSNAPGVATIDASSGLITLVSAGTVTFTASQAATSQYSTGTVTSNVLTVELGATSLTAFSVAASKTYGDASFNIAPPTIGRAGAVVYGSNAPSVATIDSSSGRITLVSAGTVTFTASQLQTSQYSTGTVTSNELTVELGATSLTAFSVADSKAYGDASFSIAPPTIGRAGAIVYGSNAPSVATIDEITGLITLVSAGTVTFTASQAATSQYSTGTVTSNVLTVSQGAPTLSALLVPALKAYGDASFSITAPAPTSKSSGAITYSSNTPSVATIDENTGVITVVFPGTVTFTASQAAVPGEYVAAAAVTSGVLTVTLSEQTVAPGTSFADSDLSGVSLAGATLIGVSFSGATLTRADFSGATVTGANFTNANIVGATNLPAFSTTQKLQLLRNTDNVGIGAVQISTPLSGAEINAAINVPIPNIAGATFIVKAPAYNSSNEKVVTVSAGDITDHTSIYIPLNSGETVIVNGAAYTFDGTNVLDSNSSIVTTLSVLGVPFRIYVGSIILLNITLMTPTISAFVVASSKMLGDAAFAITMRPTSNSSGVITYTSNRPSVATIDASGNHITLQSAGAVTFTASQAEVPEAYAAITVTSNIMSVRNAQTRAPAPMNRWFSTNNAPRASASAASDRISALRARALYRDTMNAAAQGGYKVVGGVTGPRTVVYSGPVRVDGKCLGEGISGTTGGDVPTECVAYYIRSATSYRDLLDVTRGIYAGHSETHPDAASALKVPATPPANSDWVKLITPQGDPTVAVANRLTLNAASTSDALLLLSPPPQPQPQNNNNNNNNNNAAYDAALSAAPDPLKCIQYPPNPQLSITYGGAGCFI